jgi:hypothetical protein
LSEQSNYIYKYFPGWEQVPLQTTSSSYDPNTAWWLAQCASLSYENKITVAKELHRIGFEQLTFFDTRGTQAFLAEHPGINGSKKIAILAFRGTEEDSVDILTDINFVRRLFPDENILQEPSLNKSSPKQKLYTHGGFLEGVLNVWGTALTKEIKEIYASGDVNWPGYPGISNAICQLPPDTTLYFTGHSLGGALATIAAYKAMLYRSTIQLTALYTFGSPRAVQRPLANKINSELKGKIYRVVNYTDVVPRLPPRIPVIFNFHHVDDLIYFSQSGKRKHLSSGQQLQADIGVLLLTLCEMGIWVLTCHQYTPKTIESHQINRYIKNLEREIDLK